MALAVKTTPEKSTRNPQQQLVLGSLLGALYVFVSFAIVFAGLPMLWGYAQEALGIRNPFLADSLLILVTLPLIVGLLVLGKKLEGPNPPPGVRAGAWVGTFCLLMVLLITLGIGNNWLAPAELGAGTGFVITLLVGAGLLAGLVWVYTRPGFGRWLVHVEEAGWFHATPYKANQGLRVRRGTVVGLLVVGLCGIYTLVRHNLYSAGNWILDVPFSKALFGEQLVVPIMFHLEMTLPIVLGVALLWFSWRVVNWPAFADFLIATEAEMNKVSWTTRKRLVQDTVVVLVTVFLMTMFLFFVDILWIKILSNPVVDVLRIDPQEERAKQRTEAQW
jgi:preprotein translocase SecE subunit